MAEIKLIMYFPKHKRRFWFLTSKDKRLGTWHTSALLYKNLKYAVFQELIFQPRWGEKLYIFFIFIFPRLQLEQQFHVGASHPRALEVLVVCLNQSTRQEKSSLEIACAKDNSALFVLPSQYFLQSQNQAACHHKFKKCFFTNVRFYFLIK